MSAGIGIGVGKILVLLINFKFWSIGSSVRENALTNLGQSFSFIIGNPSIYLQTGLMISIVLFTVLLTVLVMFILKIALAKSPLEMGSG